MQQNEGLPALCSCDAQFSQLIINKNDITIYDRGEDFWQKMGIRYSLFTYCLLNISKDSVYGYSINPDVNLYFYKYAPVCFIEDVQKAYTELRM